MTPASCKAGNAGVRVWTLLLHPADPRVDLDPLDTDLLDTDACGGRPPVAHAIVDPTDGRVASVWTAGSYHYSAQDDHGPPGNLSSCMTHALVLVWEGKILWSGADRLSRRLGRNHARNLSDVMVLAHEAVRLGYAVIRVDRGRSA